ncbi:myristoylated alanine-rich C-kinase substrate-like [Panicum virgatum]|uniref:myristoylated alanine-rich C-kinase substrate-like n=1 Tax=Panicum virgatum TaxID=38727 RepID=UPI0019D578CB|nr:myristoylated alanine-rich C-kinase substrate-like [Panicum virgatum]
MARGAQSAQQARAQEGGSDAGQSGTAAAALADAEGEAGRGSTESAALPDAEDKTGRGDTEDAARPGAGDDASRGDADDVTRPGDGGETGGDAPEHPASQAEGEVLIPEPAGAGDEGAAAAATVQMTPVVEVLVEEMPATASPAKSTPGAGRQR